MSVVRTAATTFPAYKTLQNVTYTDRGTQYRAVGLIPADRSLLGVDLTNGRLVNSTDDGVTWTTYCNFVFTGTNLSGSTVHWLPSGEVAIGTNKVNTGSPGASAWVSSGWATNPTTATFTKTLQLPDGLNFAYHGFGGHRNILLASEYGNSWSQTAPNSRYVYRSDDGGATWRTVFDFGSTVLVGDGGPVGVVGANVHLHGCAYDPWFDRMWLLWGDAPASSRGGAYSDDGGGTWNRVASAPELYATTGQWQCLAPLAAESGLLTLPDSVPDVVGRIGRRGWRETTDFGAAHVVVPDNSPTVPLFRGAGWFNPKVPGAPILGVLVGTGSTSPGALVTVEDGGRTFRTAFVDPAVVGGGANSVGFEAAFGPTNTGKYVITSAYTGRNANGDRIVGELLRNPETIPTPRDTQVDTYPGAGTAASGYTWTKPTGAVSVEVVCIAGGGGGGSGRQGAAGTVRFGGGGGGGGAMTRSLLPASSLPSTLTLSVGGGGLGGAGQASVDTNGTAGASGSGSTVKDGTVQLLGSNAGAGGTGGTASAGTNGAGGTGQFPGINGGNGSSGAGSNGPTAVSGSAGGGGGGGLDASNTASAGGTGGLGRSGTSAAGTAGAIGTNGGAGGDYSYGPDSGGGGGGGGAAASGAPGSGGLGGKWGSGGGGGGASLDGNTSGSGGNGAPGVIVITTRF